MSNLKPLMPKLIFYQVSWQTSAFHWSSWVPCKTWILLENLQSMWTWKKLHFYLYWTSTRPHVGYVHFPIKYYYINILPEFIWFFILPQQSATPNVLNNRNLRIFSWIEGKLLQSNTYYFIRGNDIMSHIVSMQWRILRFF